MGIVRRQSILNTLATYLGVGLGYVNKVVLFAEILTRQEYGLLELLIAYMVIGSEVGQLGGTKLIIRFFPIFQDRGEREGQFTFFALLYTLSGFALLSLLFVGLRPWFVDLYEAESPLFASQFFFLLPMILAHMLYRTTGGLARMHLRTTLATLGWEVLLRVWHTGCILVYYAGWTSFEGFLKLFVLGYFIPPLLVIADLIASGSLRFSWRLTLIRKRLLRIILTYALLTSLADATITLINKLDLAMLGALVGEVEAGVYAFGYYLAILVFIPGRSLSVILVPLLSQHIKARRWDEVGDIYRRSAINSLVAGGWFFLCIWLNLDALFALNPKFAGARYAMLFVGIGMLLNVGSGLHRAIMINSRYYRIDLLTNLGLLGVAFLTNYLLIPRLGVTGAGLATAISLFLFNAMGVGFVWLKFRQQPFSWANLKALLLLVTLALLGGYLPFTGQPFWDIAWRSALITLLYVPAAWGLRLSDDLRDLGLMVWRKVGGK